MEQAAVDVGPEDGVLLWMPDAALAADVAGGGEAADAGCWCIGVVIGDQKWNRPHWPGFRLASLGTSAVMASALLCQ